MGTNCLMCGGTGILASGEPCPDCSKEILEDLPVFLEIPAQYQGVKFDKSFLPVEMQKSYGEYMETLLRDICMNASTFQKNILICARANSGKSIWCYNVYAKLNGSGIKVPPIRDIIEVRSLLNGQGDKAESELYSSARLALIRIPRDFQPWMVDIISYIIERRVRSGGCTLFFFSGTEEDIKIQDKYNRWKFVKGSGSFNSIFVKNF